MRLKFEFYTRDVLDVAPDLLGKILAVRKSDNSIVRYMITETEAYRGEEDKACHASKGLTSRNKVMYGKGGLVYVYFVYGMYWMLNVVTGAENEPQAALIRGVEGFNGPGKLTKALGIDGSYYGEDLAASEKIWIEDNRFNVSYFATNRVGIDYAGEPWVSLPWRFVLKK
ncbi:MAG: DNA-3-methyladenine glycosylase [Bacteroidales bacterium]|nr:DNA-3-methyladenine glycosylase [Bacteroidales bacterium]